MSPSSKSSPSGIPARNPSSASRSTTTAAGTGGGRRTPARTGRDGVRRDPVEAAGVVGVPGGPRAAQGQLGQPRGAQPAQLDGGGDGHQGLVGAHVGGGLLPSDVLLAGPERGDVGPAAVNVDRLPHQPTGEAPHVGPGAGEQPEVGAAETQGGPEGLPLPHHHVGPPGARRPEDAGGHRIGGHHHQRRRCGRRAPGRRRGPPGSRGSWGSRPPARRAARRPRRRRATRSARRPGPPSRSRWPVPAAQVATTCRQWGWMPARPRRRAAGGRHPEVDRLDQGAGPVVERGVGHRQPGQPGHHGLELEDRLEDALGHLGLVRACRT